MGQIERRQSLKGVCEMKKSVYARAKIKSKKVDARLVAAFNALEITLAKKKLKVGYGSNARRHASVFEFMYMGTRSGWHAFKHYDTRNYVYVDIYADYMHVPCSRNDPFHHGEFGPGLEIQPKMGRPRKG